MSSRPGAFFRVPGQKVTTPGDYEALPSQPDGLARPMPFAPGNDIDFQVTSITEGYKRILSMIIPYYKISTSDSQVNIYGESMAKYYYNPVMLKCHIDRGDETFEAGDFGPSNTQTIKVILVHEMMVKQGVLPEVGDIILDRERYYEVTNVNEVHISFGNDDQYIYDAPNFESSSLNKRGESLVFELAATLMRPTKLNLLPYRIQ
jgi:hypothetical protein